jgi:zinc transport system ATP-binding protein
VTQEHGHAHNHAHKDGCAHDEAPSEQPLLRCKGLVVGYSGTAILPPIDLEIRPGEFWAIIGRNGSGKSTWFRTILGLLPPVDGEVEKPRGELKLAYVAQRMAFDELYPVTVEDVVEMAHLRGLKFLDPRERRRARAHSLEALDAVHAADLRGRTFRSLSEGQKQRVLLARMLASHAHIALLDEPTAAMDSVAERRTMDLLDDVRKRFNVAVVVVSHHLALLGQLADRALYVDGEHKTAVTGTPAEVFQNAAFRRQYEAHARTGVADV